MSIPPRGTFGAGFRAFTIDGWGGRVVGAGVTTVTLTVSARTARAIPVRTLGALRATLTATFTASLTSGFTAAFTAVVSRLAPGLLTGAGFAATLTTSLSV